MRSLVCLATSWFIFSPQSHRLDGASSIFFSVLEVQFKLCHYVVYFYHKDSGLTQSRHKAVFSFTANNAKLLYRYFLRLNTHLNDGNPCIPSDFVVYFSPQRLGLDYVKTQSCVWSAAKNAKLLYRYFLRLNTYLNDGNPCEPCDFVVYFHHKDSGLTTSRHKTVFRFIAEDAKLLYRYFLILNTHLNDGNPCVLCVFVVYFFSPQ